MFFQRIQQHGSKTEVTLFEIFRVLWAIDAGKVEYKVTILAKPLGIEPEQYLSHHFLLLKGLHDRCESL